MSNILNGVSRIRCGLRNSAIPTNGPFRIPSGPSRSVVIIPSRKGRPKRTRGKKSKPDPPNKELLELQAKIDDMRKFTKTLKYDIQKRREEDVEKKFEAKIESMKHSNDSEEGDIDIIYNSISSGSNQNGENLLTDGSNNISLFDQPARGIQIPQTISDKIGDNIIHLASQENQDWNKVIHDLMYSQGGLSGVSANDSYRFLSQIKLGKLSSKSLEYLHEMLQEERVEIRMNVYDFFMKHYAHLGSTLLVESFFQQALLSGMKPSHYMYSHLIKTYTKEKNLSKINQTLALMQKNQVEPGLVIYTNVLQLCVNLRDSKQANDIFQMMKFRSVQTKPDIEAYNSMILLATNEKDIYKAIDLYEELLSENLQPNLFTLNCMARCCSKDKGFFIRGWQFINEINERNLKPDFKTFEAMLRLAARDGDLELARALFMVVFKMTPDIPTAGPEALNYLMMAYRDFRFDKTPTMMLHEAGGALRKNALGLVNFHGLSVLGNDGPSGVNNTDTPPMLPVNRFVHPKQIIAESNAIWSFHLLKDAKHTLNIPLLLTYLRIPIEHSDKAEFLERFKQNTYPSPEIQNKIELMEAKKGVTNSNITVEDTDGDGKELVEVNAPNAIKMSQNLKYKIERNSALYISMLSAGKRFGDADLCEQAWIERGKYRATSSFKKQSKTDRDEQDYRFAKEMVLAFIQLGLYDDAVRIVRSTENQFDWRFYTLKPLYHALQDIGDERSMRIISAICNNRKGQNLPNMMKAQEKR